MSVNMSVNMNDDQLVMESFSPVSEGETTKSVSKSLTMKEKRTKSSIIGFLALAAKEGLLDESKWKELMDYLPLLKLVKDQKEFFSDDQFEVKEVEVEVLKPYLAERKAEIKAEKKVSKKEKVVKEKVVKEKVVKEGEEKPKRQRKPKKVVSEVVEPLVEPVSEVVDESTLDEEKVSVPVSVPVVVLEKKEKVKKAKKEEDEGEGKKRGRKAKVSIVECKQDEVNEDVVSEEDQMAELLKNRLKEKEAGEIDISDLEDVLNGLDEEEEEGLKAGTSTPILEEKKEKDKKKVKAVVAKKVKAKAEKKQENN
jgi:hypothetical protein